MAACAENSISPPPPSISAISSLTGNRLGDNSLPSLRRPHPFPILTFQSGGKSLQSWGRRVFPRLVRSYFYRVFVHHNKKDLPGCPGTLSSVFFLPPPIWTQSSKTKPPAPACPRPPIHSPFPPPRRPSLFSQYCRRRRRRRRRYLLSRTFAVRRSVSVSVVSPAAIQHLRL